MFKLIITATAVLAAANAAATNATSSIAFKEWNSSNFSEACGGKASPVRIATVGECMKIEEEAASGFKFLNFTRGTDFPASACKVTGFKGGECEELSDSWNATSLDTDSCHWMVWPAESLKLDCSGSV